MTTTLVAERAGVSVGTLYQYFPNREALLYAVLRHHFEDMASALEGIVTDQREMRVDEVADAIADAYVSVKMRSPAMTTLLYRVANVIDQSRVSGDIYIRLEAAVADAIGRIADVPLAVPDRAAFTLLAALAGLARASFASVASHPDVMSTLPEEARRLARAYLRAAVDAQRPAVGGAA